MPEYLSPGVYVEEVPPAALPIEGVGTSTAGFIGVVPGAVKMPDQPGKFELEMEADGVTPKTDANGNPIVKKDASGNPIPVLFKVAPLGQPQLITSWQEFKNAFGDFQKQGAIPNDEYKAYVGLQHAVFGFFNNGGTRCYVLRVAVAADLDGLEEELPKLDAIDEIAIVAVPGAIKKAQHEAILTHCFNIKDRFAVLDGVPAASLSDPLAIAAGVGRSESGSYGAVYFPWIKVSNPLKPDETISVPPSGHIAGIYARSDSTRGVHKAPANEVVLGALDLDQTITKAQQDGLNPSGINVISSFNGTIKVWGARTRADTAHSDFKYVNVRRFFNFLRESIDEGTQFVVFEPNTPVLWQRIIRSVSDFLLNQYNAGALFGETPKKAFFVKCDETTNPPQVRDLGQVVTEIGVAIVRPAEFVIFRIQQITGS